MRPPLLTRSSSAAAGYSRRRGQRWAWLGSPQTTYIYIRRAARCLGALRAWSRERCILNANVRASSMDDDPVTSDHADGIYSPTWSQLPAQPASQIRVSISTLITCSVSQLSGASHMRHAMHARVCFIVRVRSWGCVRVRARARMCVCLSVCVRALSGGGPGARSSPAVQRCQRQHEYQMATANWQRRPLAIRSAECRCAMRCAARSRSRSLLVSSRVDTRERHSRLSSPSASRGRARRSARRSAGVVGVVESLRLISYMVRAPGPSPRSHFYTLTSQCPESTRSDPVSVRDHSAALSFSFSLSRRGLWPEGRAPVTHALGKARQGKPRPI